MDEKFKKFIPADDVYLFNTGNARKAWLCYGCRYIPELKAHRFIVWAPNAQNVSLVGDFNGWDRYATPMEKMDGGIWVTFVEGLNDCALYKYCIFSKDGRQTFKADPFAAFSQWGMETASIVWNGGSFKWSDSKFMKKRAKQNFMDTPMSIYEVHLGSWKNLEGGITYRNLGDALAEYCVDMGYTHVEIMPVTEYPYPASWGYQVTGYYCPTSRYGNPDDFKYFIDRLHAAGIGVIMDWVPAHFPKDEHGLAYFDGTAQFECKEKRMAEHPDWGTLIFDYASSQVQSFLISSACKFFEEYHIDGIRVDAVSSMLYLNYGRNDGAYTPNKDGGYINLDAVEFFKKLNTAVLTSYPGAVTIAEESTAFPLITAPPEVGGLGFCLKWDMGFMHDTIDYMELDPYFRSFNHNRLTFSMMYAFSENYVLAYSHDEVVHGKKSMLDKMSGEYDQKFASLRALYGYQFAHPGKKLNFMGGEIGQFIEWNWEKELDWMLLDFPRHAEMQRWYRELNKLYTSTPALYMIDHSWDGFKWLNVDDAGRSSIAFMRMAPQQDSYIVCVCNFTPVDYEGFTFGLPKQGTLKEILSSDAVEFGGKGMLNTKAIRSRKKPFLDMEHSAEINLPAMSTLFFRYKITKPRAEKEDKASKKAPAAEAAEKTTALKKAEPKALEKIGTRELEPVGKRELETIGTRELSVKEDKPEKASKKEETKVKAEPEKKASSKKAAEKKQEIVEEPAVQMEIFDILDESDVKAEPEIEVELVEEPAEEVKAEPEIEVELVEEPAEEVKAEPEIEVELVEEPAEKKSQAGGRNKNTSKAKLKKAAKQNKKKKK